MLRVASSAVRRLAVRQYAVPAQTSVRSFAAEAAADDAQWRVPVKLHGIPARYAGALFTASGKAGVLDTVEKEMATIGTFAASDAKFQSFLGDPTVPVQKKIEGIRDFLTNGKFSETTVNFFAVVAENRRLNQTMGIAQTFSEIMMAHRGEVSAIVTSAEPLEAKQVEQLSGIINSKFLTKGQTIKLSTKVDPSIIGGLIVDVGDKNIDLSISTKIRKMEALLAEAV